MYLWWEMQLKMAADQEDGDYVNNACTSTYQEGYTPLCLAVKEGDEEVVQLLLKCGANVDAQDKNGKSVLHLAVGKGHEKVIKLLLKCGANVDAQDKDGKTALHLAVEKGHQKVVKLLLDCGANVDVQDKDGKTVLQLAVQKGWSLIIEHVLKHCPDVNNRSNRSALKVAVHSYGKVYGRIVENLIHYGLTVNPEDVNDCKLLHAAVEKGYEKVVKLLLECGANVDAEGDGKTLLHLAVEKGGSVIIEHILKHCPDVNNKSNRSALNVAVQGYGEGYCKIIEKLLQYGLTVSPEDVNDCKFLHTAVEKGYLKIVEELLKYGIDVNKLYKSTYGRGYMTLHVAAQNKQEEVAKLLISYGADVNAEDETGKTPIVYATENADLKVTKLLLTNKANLEDNPEPLNIAVKKKCREIVEVLLEHGADVNTSDKCGRTALHFTALDKDGGFVLHNDPDVNVREQIATLLLSRGANVNAETTNGITVLHAATQNGYAKVVEALLEYNADVNATVGTGKTPLHIAARKGHLEVIEVLLKFGANIDLQDEIGRTALHFACEEGHTQIVIALLEHGSDINIVSEWNQTPFCFASVGRCLSNDTCVFDIIFDILLHHMVKMKTANLFVSKGNLRQINRYYELSDFQNKCEEEIASMKSENVSNANVSFYDILTEGVSQLARYAGNESIVHILRSDDYKVKFPIYASMINCNFRKGERRKELLEQGNEIFHSLSNNFPQLPHDCTNKIFTYLSDEDLRILIGACKPVRGSSPNTDINNVVIT